MTDFTLREDIAAAFLGLARSHLNAAVQLTECPQRPRLKEIEGDLLDIEDDFHNWADTLDRTPTVRHRDAITGQYVDADEAAARPETTIRETRNHD